MYVFASCRFRTPSDSAFFTDGADKGIIPLTCSELFVRVDEKKALDPNVHFTVEVSYIEVRNRSDLEERTTIDACADLQRESARSVES